MDFLSADSLPWLHGAQQRLPRVELCAAAATFAVAAVGPGTWRGATGELDHRSGVVRVA